MEKQEDEKSDKNLSIDSLLDSETNLEKWLKQQQQNQEKAPLANQLLTDIQYNKSALIEIPGIAENYLNKDNLGSLLTLNTRIKDTFPLLPSEEVKLQPSTDSFSTIGTVNVYSVAVRLCESDDKEERNWGEKFSTKYVEMQEDQRKIKNLRTKTNLNFPARINDLEKAVSSYELYKAGLNSSSDVGKSLRNLLDRIKGDIFERARNFRKENMTWEIMSKRLGIDTVSYDELIRLKNKWAEIYHELSDLLKERKLATKDQVDFIYIKVIDYIYILIGLISR